MPQSQRTSLLPTMIVNIIRIAFMLAVSVAGCVVCALSGCDSVAWGGRVEVRL